MQKKKCLNYPVIKISKFRVIYLALLERGVLLKLTAKTIQFRVKTLKGDPTMEMRAVAKLHPKHDSLYTENQQLLLDSILLLN